MHASMCVYSASLLKISVDKLFRLLVKCVIDESIFCDERVCRWCDVYGTESTRPELKFNNMVWLNMYWWANRTNIIFYRGKIRATNIRYTRAYVHRHTIGIYFGSFNESFVIALIVLCVWCKSSIHHLLRQQTAVVAMARHRKASGRPAATICCSRAWAQSNSYRRYDTDNDNKQLRTLAHTHKAIDT